MAVHLCSLHVYGDIMSKVLQVVLGLAALLVSALLVAAARYPAVEAVMEGVVVGVTGRPVIYTATPEVRDWSSVRIKLERTECFGTCPIYTVEIAGDGSVTYEGELFVGVVGVQRATVPVERVRQLVASFRAANFFWLYDRYVTPVTDNPTYVVSLAYDGRSKTVLDYVGREAGMPAEVTKLEDAIDEAAETARWVKGGRAQEK